MPREKTGTLKYYNCDWPQWHLLMHMPIQVHYCSLFATIIIITNVFVTIIHLLKAV